MPPIGPDHAYRAATIARCIHVLQQGLLRARFIAGGVHWPPGIETPNLPGPGRRSLGELLDALHNLPTYLADVVSDTRSRIPESVTDRAFRDFDDVYARTDPRGAAESTRRQK
jgi:hypothetical protein